MGRFEVFSSVILPGYPEPSPELRGGMAGHCIGIDHRPGEGERGDCDGVSPEMYQWWMNLPPKMSKSW